MCDKLPLSKRDAQAALKLAQTGKQYRKERRKYFCIAHNAWHLTSQPQNRKEQEVNFVSTDVKQAFENLLNKTESVT
jgi:hypothetical protein